jgi:hypothetical protein
VFEKRRKIIGCLFILQIEMIKAVAAAQPEISLPIFDDGFDVLAADPDSPNFVPADHPKREKILSIFQGLWQALVKYQDQETGLWYQVVDQGQRQGSFLEASASSMFIYALAKAIRLGYIGEEYLPAAQKG